ncbi:nickel pincer cofactor biosynthesis protein LarC [Chloroflexi bacterium TSY]|nr:nickel pincer cofactor biosynthesis protein LarC [Chloroflexi bacterium TSY]
MIAYLDMPSGISGDIFLGCLVDSGWPIDALRATIQQLKLPIDSWAISAASVMRGPLRATLIDVQVAEGDTHRHLGDIRKIFHAAALPNSVKEQSIAIFTRLAEAEARVHGSSVEDVHFHEVGALDAIIDVVGTVAGLHALGIEQLYASSFPLGSGWIQSAHGHLPLPAPATLNLLADVQAPTRPAPGPGELVTPTGAAIVAELAHFTQPSLKLHCIGLGAGRKEFEWPNIARLWLGKRIGADEKAKEVVGIDEDNGADVGRGIDSASFSQQESLSSRELVEIATNIDDMNPELYGIVSEKLFAAGALDVWTTPIQMKKGRPGLLLSVLVHPNVQNKLINLLLCETTTLGVRVRTVTRYEAEREMQTVATRYGDVKMKLKWIGDSLISAKPEFDDCVVVAQEHSVSVQHVITAAQVAFAAERQGGKVTG